MPVDPKIREQLWIISAALGWAAAAGEEPPFPRKAADAQDDKERRKAAIAERLEALAPEDVAALNETTLDEKLECLLFDLSMGENKFLGMVPEPGRAGMATTGLTLRTEIEGVKAWLTSRGQWHPTDVSARRLQVADERIRARFGLYASGTKKIAPDCVAHLSEMAQAMPDSFWWYHLPVTLSKPA